jgi:Ser/Thr protein kinase RdoA (MazF antagonist)
VRDAVQPTPDLLARWGLGQARWTPVPGGHINRTFRLEAGERSLILQWLNPVFGPEINLDIEAVTARLEAAGLLTPRLVRTVAPDAGELWARDVQGIWRVMTLIEGRVIERADSEQRCHSAGRLLGRFHRALWGWAHRFRHRRPGVHDTRRHLDNLRQALQRHRDHRLHARVAMLAHKILQAADALELPDGLPLRVVHGDPKITNVMFAADSGEAVAMVDLDTLARMPVAVELGDALRSWCCPGGEEQQDAGFHAGFYRAALEGWAGAVGPLPDPAEARAIPATVEVIAVELAARFCADALQERYFGWDAARFGSAGEHNLLRARSQLALAASVRHQLPSLRSLARSLW